MSDVLSLTMLAETLRISVPYAAAAVAGVLAERSGVVQIGLEGILLGSAFSAVAVAHATGSPSAGVLGGVCLGVGLSLVHGLLVEKARVHAVVSGIALNLFAFAATRLGLRALYDSASNSPAIEAFRFGPTGGSGAALLARVLLDPLFLLVAAAVAVTPFFLSRTPLGLRLRAAGENPEAVTAAGLDVSRVRLAALALSGAACALGGVHLAYDQHSFESGMSSGRGFIALAAVVVAGWRPVPAAAACLAFAALEALQIVLQDSVRKSFFGPLVPLLPYVATLVVLGFTSFRSSAPRALGRDG